MAEGLLRDLAGDRFDVYSAGTDPHPIHPLTFAAMAERGIDIGEQRPTNLKEYLGKLTVSYLIVVCDRAKDSCPRIWPGLDEGKRLYWPFDDPASFEGTDAEKLAQFEGVRDQIEARLREWLGEIEQA
jgi:arsenate reductase